MGIGPDGVDGTAGPSPVFTRGSAPFSFSASSCAATSTSDGRSSAFFASIPSSSRSRSGGISAHSSCGARGALLRCMCSTSIALSASNGGRPSSISYAVAPSE